jgi:TonB family protein
MKKERKQQDFLVKPYYSGGPKALSAFIYSHLVYPQEAIDHKTEGTVVIVIDINHKGEVINSKIKQSLGHGCDEAAREVVNKLHFNLDQVVRRGKTIFHKTLNIHFKLPKIDITPIATTELKYTITKKKEEKSSDDSSSYHYTIDL